MIRLSHDGRSLEFRFLSNADVEAIRHDRAAYDLPPGDPRPASPARPLVLTALDFAFLDLPQLTEDQPAHRPSSPPMRGHGRASLPSSAAPATTGSRY